MEAKPRRVVVWSTGGVGSIAIDAVHRRPDLELVGVWVHSQDKVGRDAGELAGREPIGDRRDQRRRRAHRPATRLRGVRRGRTRTRRRCRAGLRPAARGRNQCRHDDFHQPGVPADLLRPGLARPTRGGSQVGPRILYASGIFPGFGSDQLALLLTTQSKKIRRLKVTEVALNDHYPVADTMMNGMGFGHPLDFEPMLKTPGFIEMAWAAPIQLMADGLGVKIEEVRGSLDRRLTDRDIEVAFGTVKAGTCGAILTRAAGVVERPRSDRGRTHHPDGPRRRARLAGVGVRRDVSRRHRRRTRHPLLDEPG